MKELNLLLQLPQDVSTRYRSVDMTVLAAFATLVCQRHCVSLCKGKKLKNSAKQNSWDSMPVSAFASGNSYFINSLVQKLQNSAQAEFWDCTPVLAFETGVFFPEFSSAEFGGFGSRRLISQSFLGAKAPLQSVFAKDTAFLSAKAQNSRIRRSRILGQYAGFSLWNVFPLMEPAV